MFTTKKENEIRITYDAGGRSYSLTAPVKSVADLGDEIANFLSMVTNDEYSFTVKTSHSPRSKKLLAENKVTLSEKEISKEELIDMLKTQYEQDHKHEAEQFVFPFMGDEEMEQFGPDPFEFVESLRS